MPEVINHQVRGHTLVEEHTSAEETNLVFGEQRFHYFIKQHGHL